MRHVYTVEGAGICNPVHTMDPLVHNYCSVAEHSLCKEGTGAEPKSAPSAGTTHLEQLVQ
jgi:hypothetical protein